MIATDRLLPTTEFVGQILKGILRKPVVVTKAAPLDLIARPSKVYGVYRDKAIGKTCLCVLDLPLAAWLAGTFVQFPPAVINEVLRTGRLEEGMIDPLGEIFNIMSRLCNEHAHYAFQQLCQSDADLPADAAPIRRTPAARLDVQVSVGNAAVGRLTILVGPN